MTRFRLGVPWFALAGSMALGLLVVLCGSVRTGGVIIALALVGGAAARAVLPGRYVQDISVRSRTFDVAGYLALGILTFGVFTGVRLH